MALKSLNSHAVHKYRQTSIPSPKIFTVIKYASVSFLYLSVIHYQVFNLLWLVYWLTESSYADYKLKKHIHTHFQLILLRKCGVKYMQTLLILNSQELTICSQFIVNPSTYLHFQMLVRDKQYMLCIHSKLLLNAKHNWIVFSFFKNQ